MAGYSGTPLSKKLGLKEKQRLALLHAPASFSLDPLPDGVQTSTKLAGKEPLDVIVLFVKARVDLEQQFAAAANRLTPAGRLWVAWPKRASGAKTDLTEDAAREVGLPEGLVDNKVCAIDETWSGLQFVWRLENRAKREAAARGRTVTRRQ
ncbi:MAG TPA: hypothetical protein VIG99_05715 [Myxococcaceae bacterium]|jgi:hypothetical protein